jgi:hypothetical protein
MNDYRLTLTVVINGVDDPDARSQANKFAQAVNAVAPQAEAKLQRVYPDRPPIKVPLDRKGAPQ